MTSAIHPIYNDIVNRMIKEVDFYFNLLYTKIG